MPCFAGNLESLEESQRFLLRNPEPLGVNGPNHRKMWDALAILLLSMAPQSWRKFVTIVTLTNRTNKIAGSLSPKRGSGTSFGRQASHHFVCAFLSQNADLQSLYIYWHPDLCAILPRLSPDKSHKIPELFLGFRHPISGGVCIKCAGAPLPLFCTPAPPPLSTDSN